MQLLIYLPGGVPCNVSDHDHKLLISPLSDSSDKGLSDIACLLGFIYYNEDIGNLLLHLSATAIHFSP